MAAKSATSGGLLTEKQQRFADEYLVDFNAVEAYARAGYKGKRNVAASAASRMLAMPQVQAYLKKRQADLAAKHEVTIDAVIQRVAFMALGDIRGLFDERGNLKPMSDLTPEQASLIQGVDSFEVFEGKGDERVSVGVTRKIRLVNRLDAVKALGQHLGMFQKKVEVSGPGGGPIQHTAIADVLADIDGADTGTGAAAGRRE